ncbi:hypothetical protein VSU16_05245 [Cetobacterium somerae]|uniref:hypothetical protein n=1 Tax=Cetobacterium somerae TaxID=188913 RepID=UPI002E7AD64F|nr:hypothetical protein [Cetobacterium somerae]WVJ02151.1 hypothetical protein VSU16_05245 [Cetobacterium somerae]
MLESIKDNDILIAMSTVMGISGYSLRDFAKYICKSNLKIIFLEKLNGKINTEKKKEQVASCLIEIEDYIENSKNLDSDLFKAIGNVLINGIELDELYTREYIKILKELSWLDLKVLIKISEINEIQEDEVNLMSRVSRIIEIDEGNKLEEKIEIDSCPKELIKMSIDNLVDKKLVYEYAKEITIEEIVKKEEFSNFNYMTAQKVNVGNYSKTYKKVKKEYLSELGVKIINLLNEQ